MASTGRAMMDGDYMRHAEYSPKSNITTETDIDKRFGGTLIAVGLGVAAAGFAGRYAFHLWRPLGQVITEAAKKVPSAILILRMVSEQATGRCYPLMTFSAYYKGGFEQKMSRREASLILGISPNSTKTKVREAHRKIMVLNHPDKGGSPYIAAKINEAKDLLDSGPRR